MQSMSLRMAADQLRAVDDGDPEVATRLRQLIALIEELERAERAGA
jgi:hypothetical protein